MQFDLATNKSNYQCYRQHYLRAVKQSSEYEHHDHIIISDLPLQDRTSQDRNIYESGRLPGFEDEPVEKVCCFTDSPHQQRPPPLMSFRVLKATPQAPTRIRWMQSQDTAMPPPGNGGPPAGSLSARSRDCLNKPK